MKHQTAFSLTVPPLIVGPGSHREAGAHARALGLRRVLLVSDRTLAVQPPVARVAAALVASGLAVERFTATAIEPTEAALDAAGTAARAARADGIVSVGGGSVLDTGKAAALLAGAGGAIGAYLPGGGRDLTTPPLPHLACPTTFGTAAETTGIIAFSRDGGHGKTTLASPLLRPHLGLLDPEALAGLPPAVLAANAFDLLSHALESATARPHDSYPAPADPARRPVTQGANPFADLGCVEAIRLVAEALPRALAAPADPAPREALLRAGLLAGTVFGMAGNHLPHAMSYPISTLGHHGRMAGYPADSPLLPHGLAVGLAAPAAFRWLEARLPERCAPLAAALGAATLADGLTALLRAAGLPNGLAALGLGPDSVPALAEGALAQRRLIDNAPLPVERGDLIAIATAALRLWP